MVTRLIEGAKMTISFDNFLSDKIRENILKDAKPIPGVIGLVQIGELSGIENTDSLNFLLNLYLKTKDRLQIVLSQRAKDRKFVDERTKSCTYLNRELGFAFSHEKYQTVLGMSDDQGRVVWGPKNSDYHLPRGDKIAPLPNYLQGHHVTLFGPPDSAKLAINAMNCYHRKIQNEPSIVQELLDETSILPKWGADDEDSKTPIRQDLMEAANNLKKCFDKTLSFEDKKLYLLEKSNLAHPIKRIPGLALPCTFLFHEATPLPLHLYDFALHLFCHYKNPEALTFYIPKLENEEEAAYLKLLIHEAEMLIKEIDDQYKIGTVKILLVLESPRAIFRLNEMIDELNPYFAGASLGWHDFLASTARFFKEDPNYKIPVKADPNIVIKYIKGSHELLANIVGGRGGVKIGGMYGVLPTSNDLKHESFQLTLKGYFKDLITQFKRGLDGFWVAHPDFVRFGISMIVAWKAYKQGQKEKLEKLISELLLPKYKNELLEFIAKEDIQGIDHSNPLYARSLLAAVGDQSQIIANNDIEEIRYNIFQTLQYLADWLSGNGCVALPATINGVPVRIMDDLATTERSRWEVWHEIHHGRFDLYRYLEIAHEELNFIRKNKSTDQKLIQVAWDERTEKWYPVAFKLMIKLMTDSKPVEFATELLLPFTHHKLRTAHDPWGELLNIDFEKYHISDSILKFCYYFEICGSYQFARTLAQNVMIDLEQCKELIMQFNDSQIISAASFHGDIGEKKVGLDKMALSEQSQISSNEELTNLSRKYLQDFGFKFLVSAKGKTDSELLSILKERIRNTKDEELKNAKEALWQITQRRITETPINKLAEKIKAEFDEYQINAAQICFIDPLGSQVVNIGECNSNSYFQIASLSKTFATNFALEYFKEKNIPLNTKVNELLRECLVTFQIPDGDDVELLHLMNHTALNLHYVNGVPYTEQMPVLENFLRGNTEYAYEAIKVINKPGTKFRYSGGGFLILEYLIEVHSGKKIPVLMEEFLNKLEIKNLTFNHKISTDHWVNGYYDDGKKITDGRIMFPAFAAGASGTALAVADYLKKLENAYHNIDGHAKISHEVACTMLTALDLGSYQFMGAKMGVGVFVAEAEDNSFMVHQGANNGFRSIFLHCFKGPDRGKGIVVFANAEFKGVLFNAMVTQLFLLESKIKGINYTNFIKDIAVKDVSPENIVNFGYKKLIFDSFKPRLPEKNIYHGELDFLSSYNCLVNSQVVDVSNDRFARAENLVSIYLPVFDPTLFGKEGKVMDSWESSRHNHLEYDMAVFKLSQISDINFIKICTKYHLGNHAPCVNISHWTGQAWENILPNTDLNGHSELCIKLPSTIKNVSMVKVKIIPDGGLTRLGLYQDLPETEKSKYKLAEDAISVMYPEKIPQSQKPLSIPFILSEVEINNNLNALQSFNVKKEFNNASAYYGAKVLSASNQHYSPASSMLSPFGPINMFDGFETARSRVANHYDQVIVQLARKAKIHRLELEFTYFVNNNPQKISIHAFDGTEWHLLFDQYPVKRFAGNKVKLPVESNVEFEQIKLQTWPDGGVNRLKAYSYYKG